VVLSTYTAAGQAGNVESIQPAQDEMVNAAVNWITTCHPEPSNTR
jgi:hypothetical protein